MAQEDYSLRPFQHKRNTEFHRVQTQSFTEEEDRFSSMKSLNKAYEASKQELLAEMGAA